MASRKEAAPACSTLRRCRSSRSDYAPTFRWKRCRKPPGGCWNWCRTWSPRERCYWAGSGGSPTAGPKWPRRRVGPDEARNSQNYRLARNLRLDHAERPLCHVPATVQYRIITTAAVQGAVDVSVSATGTTSGTPTASSLAFQSATSYLSQAPGALVMKLTQPGTQTIVGAPAGYTLQAGTAGTTASDPILGSGQGGSVPTPSILEPTPTGKVLGTFATPGVVYFPDVQPPRTTSP